MAKVIANSQGKVVVANNKALLTPPPFPIVDQTFTLERLQPTAYDAETGYYTVDSFPSWVEAANGENFSGILNIVDFSAANAVPFHNGNATNAVLMKKEDSTHFSIVTTAPGGTPNPSAFFFTKPNLYIELSVGDGEKSRYRLVAEKTPALLSRYGGPVINATDNNTNYLGGVSPRAVIAYGYDIGMGVQGTLVYEFTIDTSTSPASITAHEIREEGLEKTNATTFATYVRPTVFGDSSINIWGTIQDGKVYIKGFGANHALIADGTRIRIYKL